MKITVRQLERLGACDDQVLLFALYFGKSAEVTLENCLAAAELGLHIDWAAERLLPPVARVAYRAALRPAWAAYDAARAPALAAYRAAAYRAAGRRAARTARALLAAVVPAVAEYDAALATAFYRAVVGEGKAKGGGK